MTTPADAVSAVAREVLVALERLLTQAAIGAARTEVRLAGIARRHEDIETHAREVAQVIARMRAGMEAAAPAAAKTAEAANRVAAITREGRALSAQSMTSMRTLLRHGETTNKRLQQLLVKIREVTGVSRLIDEIASQTRFLALNASIEASRAGAAGRAFAVVAGEVRELANSTADKTSKIEELVHAIIADLEPARADMEESRALGAQTAKSVEAVDERLAQVNELAEQTSKHVGEIAQVIKDENQSVAALGDATRNVVASLGELREEARHISEAAFAVSAVTDDGHRQLARVDIDTMFHDGLALCRELARGTGRILQAAVDQRRCTLDAVLVLEYREIKGPDIPSLAHLFDVSRVPKSGFTPPKYHTAYDALVDRELQVLCDDLTGREPRLLFALPIGPQLLRPEPQPPLHAGLDGQARPRPGRQSHQALLHRQQRARPRRARRPRRTGAGAVAPRHPGRFRAGRRGPHGLAGAARGVHDPDLRARYRRAGHGRDRAGVRARPPLGCRAGGLVRGRLI
jgi:methyl-accepting chemotaxis protein